MSVVQRKIFKRIVKSEMDQPTITEMLAPACPEQLIAITSGLNKSDTVYDSVPVSKVADYLNGKWSPSDFKVRLLNGKRQDCYERTQPIPTEPGRTLNRAYIDLDGELPYDMSEADFTRKVEEITLILIAYCADDKALKESCKWRCADSEGEVMNKLSYTIHFKNLCGTKKAISHYVKSKLVKQLTQLLQETVPVLSVLKKESKKKAGDKYIGKLIIDFSVYNDGNRKMRMLGQSKPVQERPYKLVCGSFEDTLITLIPTDCPILPEPQSVLKLAALPEPETEALENPGAIEDNQSLFSTEASDPNICSEDAIKNREMLMEVITALGQHRWDYYPDWIRIGFVMFNEGYTVDDLITVSAKSAKWQSGSPNWVKAKWRMFRKSNLSGVLLWKWLSEDDPEKYAELSLRRQDFWGLLKAGHPQAEVARYFYNLKPDAYAFNERIGWFQLQPNNIWKQYSKQPNGLLADIWHTLMGVANEHKNKINLEETDEEKSKMAAARLKALHAFRKSIGTKGFVEGVIGFLPRCYNDDDLDAKMDESRHLVAFSDAVYDLDKHELRAIEPEDYVCLNTGYVYPATRHPEARKELVRTIRSIFEADSEIEIGNILAMSPMTSYVLKTCALTLHGRKKYEKFFVWTGTGGNGKGLLAELLKRALGSYYHTVPHQCLTKPQDKKDAPNPALAKSKGKRACIMTEPEADDTIQVGAAKEWTGGDMITARDLHTSTVCFVPQFVLYLQTNNIPKLNRADGGIMRRMDVVPFPFKFVENPNPDEPLEKKINIDLKEKIIKSEEWRGEMWWLLLEAYKLLEADGLKVPPEVKTRSSEYMEEQNPILDWLRGNYEIGFPKEDKRYWLESSKLLKAYNLANNSSMKADAFKSAMECATVSMRKVSHEFSATRWVSEKLDNGDWHSEWRLSTGSPGNYWVGIKKLKAPSPPEFGCE